MTRFAGLDLTQQSEPNAQLIAALITAFEQATVDEDVMSMAEAYIELSELLGTKEANRRLQIETIANESTHIPTLKIIAKMLELVQALTNRARFFSYS